MQVKLPHEPVGWSVCHNFLKGREFSIPMLLPEDFIHEFLNYEIMHENIPFLSRFIDIYIVTKHKKGLFT